jgi:hypothetical protein
MKPGVMQLGRFGDILNILPLLHFLNSAGQRQTLIVAKEFSSIQRHVTYADVELYHGAFEDYLGASAYCARKFNPLMKASVYGNGFTFTRETPHFCQEAYHRCHHGYGRMFEQGHFNQIVLENISPDLAHHYCKTTTKPILLINFAARSSPFPNAHQWHEIIKSDLANDFEIIDIGAIRAPSFCDLLSLYRKADLLITVDTGTLHLAGACDLPYIAFQNDLWAPWYMGYTRGNCLLKIPYSQEGGARHQVIETARRVLSCA